MDLGHASLRVAADTAPLGFPALRGRIKRKMAELEPQRLRHTEGRGVRAGEGGAVRGAETVPGHEESKLQGHGMWGRGRDMGLRRLTDQE